MAWIASTIKFVCDGWWSLKSNSNLSLLGYNSTLTGISNPSTVEVIKLSNTLLFIDLTPIY